MLNWLVIGGGIQGCTLAVHLLAHNKACPQSLAIVDPHPSPLSTWKRCTSTIHMPYMRSPVVHHIDVQPFSLSAFAKKIEATGPTHFKGIYERPSLELFNHHCDTVIHNYHLEQCWHQGLVTQLTKTRRGWLVKLNDGTEVESRAVILAISHSHQPLWPDWAAPLKQNGSNIYHVFDQDIPSFTELNSPIVIVGGGISAAHTAITLSRLYPHDVTLLTRHPLRVEPFDSDPGWLGPKNMKHFQTIKDYRVRRQLIVEARHRGSMPKDVYFDVKQAEKKNGLHIIHSEVASAEKNGGCAQSTADSSFSLQLTNEEQLNAHTIVLATGFHQQVPGSEWLQSTINENDLTCAQCGYPIVSPVLEWGPELFVAGALAELEIGPVARNIAGAQRAAERIIQAM